MKLLQKLARGLNRVAGPPPLPPSLQPQPPPTLKITPEIGRRSYAAAEVNRLTEDWFAPETTADTELWTSLPRMRARSRELLRNNEYAVRIRSIFLANVIGASGIGHQSKIKDAGGGYDVFANRAVESSFDLWGSPKHCSPSGMLSWVDLQNLAFSSCFEGGAVLARKLYNVGEFGFQIQLLEIERLAYTLNNVLPNGNYIRFGIECDPFGRRLAYHIYRVSPNETFGQNSQFAGKIDRIPASEIIHLYLPTRPGQSNGAPWLAPVMLALQSLARYREAALIAAQTAACSMGFFVTPATDTHVGDSKDGDGNETMSIEPGAFRKLNTGQDFRQFTPQHPTSTFSEFFKSQLRSIASGAEVSYCTLANDFTEATFSSVRASILEERTSFMAKQNWFIDHFVKPIFDDWLTYALLNGKITLGGSVLPFSKREKFNQSVWNGRRWGWIDPEKDVDAAKKAIELGIESRRGAATALGRDIEDVMEEQAADISLADESGLILSDHVRQSELSKLRLDGYGVGVRAGALTPNPDDEKDLRAKCELPPVNRDVLASWKLDGNARKPITLQSGDTPSVNPSAQPETAPQPKPAIPKATP